MQVHVTVRWFAMLRERRGQDSEELEVEAGTTVGGLYASLVLAPRVPVSYALDRELVPAHTPIHGPCEVAFLPPVGGG